MTRIFLRIGARHVSLPTARVSTLGYHGQGWHQRCVPIDAPSAPHRREAPIAPREPRASTPIVGEQTSRCPRLTIDRLRQPPRQPPRFRSHRTPRVPPRVRPPRVRVRPHQRVPRRGRILRVPRQVRLGPRTVAQRLRLCRREHRRRRQAHLLLHALHPWGRAVGPTRRRARAGV